MHQPVIRQVGGEIRVSCACTTRPNELGGHDRHEFWGVTRDWPDTVSIYNNGEHNGTFGDDDRIGLGRHRAQ